MAKEGTSKLGRSRSEPWDASKLITSSTAMIMKESSTVNIDETNTTK